MFWNISLDGDLELSNHVKDVAKWILELVLNFMGVSLLGGLVERMTIPLPSSLQTIAGIAFLIVAWCLGVYFVWTWKRTKVSVDPRFSFIAIYYSDSQDTPDTPKPHHPYFVANHNIKQAYLVPELIDNYVRKHTFDYRSFDGEKSLKDWFKKQDITPHDRYPTSYEEELGLRFKRDGTLYGIFTRMNPELLAEYKENKLKFQDLRLLLIYPWLKPKAYPPTRRVLLKISTKEPFEPPLIDLELYENNVLDGQVYSRLPREPYKVWCWRNHFKQLRRWRYPIENLLPENQN